MEEGSQNKNSTMVPSNLTSIEAAGLQCRARVELLDSGLGWKNGRMQLITYVCPEQTCTKMMDPALFH